jgi:Lrp/AsnC family transcriptional regulator, leucine-responsive regulatory protein
MLDAIDTRILELLQADARMPNTEIAKEVGLVPSAVLERIRRLEKKGIIEGYGARVNPKALGQGLAAYIAVRSTERVGTTDTARQIAKLPQHHHRAGDGERDLRPAPDGTRLIPHPALVNHVRP